MIIVQQGCSRGNKFYCCNFGKCTKWSACKFDSVELRDRIWSSVWRSLILSMNLTSASCNISKSRSLLYWIGQWVFIYSFENWCMIEQILPTLWDYVGVFFSADEILHQKWSQLNRSVQICNITKKKNTDKSWDEQKVRCLSDRIDCT